MVIVFNDLGESEFENKLGIDFSDIFNSILILYTFSLVTAIDYFIQIKTHLLH